MCGITGWVYFNRDLTPERPVIDAMTATMAKPRAGRQAACGAPTHAAHRPPTAVRHRPGGRGAADVGAPPRLGRAGRSRGRASCSTFSGEVYNYTELRTDLPRWATFTTAPTPRSCYAVPAWGAAWRERLNGMFAFASGTASARSCCWSATASA